MNPNVFGCFVEYLFATKAMESGLLVSFPLLHTSTYDCIVDSPNGLFKIQIKGINEDNRTRNRIQLNCRNKSKYEKKDVDFFAVYSAERKGFFIFKNDGKIQSFTIGLEKYSKFFNNFAAL
tara:strand:- start:9683 stop:10045 length:363 start_codon:yes stop_codon:yes gene_type:complete